MTFLGPILLLRREISVPRKAGGVVSGNTGKQVIINGDGATEIREKVGSLQEIEVTLINSIGFRRYLITMGLICGGYALNYQNRLSILNVALEKLMIIR